MSPVFIRLLAASAGALLLIAAGTRSHTPVVMSSAANAWLNTLTEEQKAKAVFTFNDEERLNWHFIPRERKGLSYKLMTPEQRPLAMALLNASLSQQGYIKATSIMSLEEILKIQEKNTPPGRRDPENYFFSVFGSPSETGTWGFRFEGHHVAMNFTIVGDKVSSSPMFYGTNPAEVKEGPRKGLRVLGHEEDYGRALVKALTADQKKTAIVATEALKDIITMASRKAALEGQPSGLSAAKMTSAQRQLLMNLLEEYTNNVPEQGAAARREQVRKAGTNINFAWTGGIEKGEGHYYRVQGPTFLVEYDNTQNNNNHVHAVWRDYNGDFGYDLLGNHYQTSHR
ncbi:MAG TPA: DUF3500 domain-containing protein [Bryobacteraceae bacterium]|nr:DUF3500 domain-containing protein [Bryobacteraceae bacterium]